jgi:hypothetical protein
MTKVERTTFASPLQTDRANATTKNAFGSCLS